MSNFIEHQQWRYATKKFDSDREISSYELEFLKEAICYSTSSYGLQPYKVLIIESKELRRQLQEHSWNQSQITQASHLMVFAHYTAINEDLIDQYINRVAVIRDLEVDQLKGYGMFMKSKILQLSAQEQAIWCSKQTYLALGNLINAAAELKIDLTPMEGFDVHQYNNLLQLTPLGLSASLVATIGYRHAEDATQYAKKVRKSKEELFLTI